MSISEQRSAGLTFIVGTAWEVLAHKQRVDRRTKRAMSQRMVETIEGLALEKPQVPLSAIYRDLKDFASKTGERLPSYPAVYRVVKTIPVSLMS